MNWMKTQIEVNPIVMKELRSRMRGGRAFLTLTLLLLVTGSAMLGMIALMSNVGYSNSGMLSYQIGNVLFNLLVTLELLMVCAIAPAVTASAVSGEIEKMTFDLLLATPLDPARILWGKLFSAMSYIILLLFAAIPLASIVFVFGGITPLVMLKALIMLCITGIMAGCMGLFFSALFRRSGRATIVSLLVMVILLLVPVFTSTVLLILNQQNMPRWFVALSPISAVISSILTVSGQQMGYNPLSYIFLGGMLDQSLVPVSMTTIPRPVYHYSFVIFSGLSIAFYLGAVSLIDPVRRWRLTRKQALAGLLLFIILAGFSLAVFFSTADHYEWYTSPSTDAATFLPTETPFDPSAAETQRVIVPDELQDTPTPMPTSVE